MAGLLDRVLSPSTASVVIPAERPDVYAVIADPTTYPEWLAGAQNIRGVDPAFPAKGSGFDHEVGPIRALTVADDSVSEGARPPEQLALEVHARFFTAHVEFRLRVVDGGTEVSLSEVPSGPWAAAMPVLRPALYLRNKGSLERLRSRFSEVASTT